MKIGTGTDYLEENDNNADLAAKIDAGMAAELGTAGPHKIKGIVDAVMADVPNTFPVFNFYAVFDSALGAYIEPQFHVSDAVAYREWKGRVSSYVHAPDDFELRYLGRWDQGSGAQIPDEERVVARAMEILNGTE